MCFLDLPEFDSPIIAARNEIFVLINGEIVELVRLDEVKNLLKSVDPEVMSRYRKMELPILHIH